MHISPKLAMQRFPVLIPKTIDQRRKLCERRNEYAPRTSESGDSMHISPKLAMQRFPVLIPKKIDQRRKLCERLNEYAPRTSEGIAITVYNVLAQLLKRCVVPARCAVESTEHNMRIQNACGCGTIQSYWRSVWCQPAALWIPQNATCGSKTLAGVVPSDALTLKRTTLRGDRLRKKIAEIVF